MVDREGPAQYRLWFVIAPTFVNEPMVVHPKTVGRTPVHFGFNSDAIGHFILRDFQIGVHRRDVAKKKQISVQRRGFAKKKQISVHRRGVAKKNQISKWEETKIDLNTE